jgi:putative acetyltransferase
MTSILAGCYRNQHPERTTMTIIRRATAEDIESIREVNRQAFGGDDEGRLVDLLRDGGFARLSLVATLHDHVIGHILFSDLTIATGHGTIHALALAPMAVFPSEQRRGIGSMLVREGLLTAKESGHRIVIVLGHAAFYERFGFSVQLARPLRSPYSGPNFMALALQPGALDDVEGEVRYSPPFFPIETRRKNER